MKDANKLKNYREKYKRYYGIEFGKDYVVHHIDENRENNDISNLLLLPAALHSKYHAYKAMYLLSLSQTDGQLCLDLTYTGSCIRGWQLSQLDNLLGVMREMHEWIERKHLADVGCVVYPEFERRDENANI